MTNGSRSEKERLGWSDVARMDTGPGRVLIVDDEASVRSVLERLITKFGHEVRSVGSAEAADQWLGTERYDVCLLDLGLPGMHGSEFLRWAFERDPEMAVIVLTGEDRPEVAVECLNQGARSYLVKPVDPRFLSWSIRDALSLRRVLRERNRTLDTGSLRDREVAG